VARLVTETIASEVETVTRSICATATSGYPCYPCVLGTPAPGEEATVKLVSQAGMGQYGQTETKG